MRVRLGIPGLSMFILGAAVPVQAQYITYGCPAGAAQVNQLNGFTAGTSAPSQICLLGPANTWVVGGLYDVTLRDPAQGTTAVVSNIQPQSDTLLFVTVPATFYATVANPGQAD